MGKVIICPICKSKFFLSEKEEKRELCIFCKNIYFERGEHGEENKLSGNSKSENK